MVRNLADRVIDRRSLLKLGGGLLAAGGGMVMPDNVLGMTDRQGANILNVARGMIGTTYRLPPSPNYQAPPYPRPKNIDCSMLAQYAYWQGAGILLPRTAAQQFAACRYCSLQLGALVFFDTVNPTPRAVTHVGIYSGYGRMVDANSVQGVVEENFANSRYWTPKLIAIGTI